MLLCCKCFGCCSVMGVVVLWVLFIVSAIVRECCRCYSVEVLQTLFAVGVVVL